MRIDCNVLNEIKKRAQIDLLIRRTVLIRGLTNNKNLRNNKNLLILHPFNVYQLISSNEQNARNITTFIYFKTFYSYSN